MAAQYPPGFALLGVGHGGETHSRMHGRDIGATSENVLAYGAVPDDSTDSYDAIMEAIEAAFATGGSVYFPSPATPGGTPRYFVGTQIDLSPYPNIHLRGGSGKSGWGPGQFGRTPMSEIRGAPGLESVIKYSDPATGTLGRLSFDDLVIMGAETAVFLDNCAEIRFRNCQMIAAEGSTPTNSALRVRDSFWVDLSDHCVLAASVVGKPSMLVESAGGPNIRGLDQFYMNRGALHRGGIRVDVQQPNATTIHNWNLQNVIYENGSTPFLDLSKSGTGSLTAYEDFVLINCEIADQVSNFAFIRLNSAGTTLKSTTLIACSGGPKWAVQLTAGSASGISLYNSSVNGAWKVVDSSGSVVPGNASWVSHNQTGMTIVGSEPLVNLTTVNDASGPAIMLGADAEANARLGLSSSGKVLFGPGAGDGGWDAELSRPAANVLSTGANDVFKTGQEATGGRPSAATVGLGAQFYDVTLGKPIWSNGSVWKDAAGNTV